MIIKTKITPTVTPMTIAEFLLGSEGAAVTKFVVVVIGGCKDVVVEVVELYVVFDVVVFLVVVEDLVVEVVVDGSLLKLHSGVNDTSSIAISESPGLPTFASMITWKSISLSSSTSTLLHLLTSICSTPLI